MDQRIQLLIKLFQRSNPEQVREPLQPPPLICLPRLLGKHDDVILQHT